MSEELENYAQSPCTSAFMHTEEHEETMLMQAWTLPTVCVIALY